MEIKKAWKALVTDDDRDIVEIVRVSFEKEGIPTVGAYSGAEAVEQVIAGEIGVAFIDVRMPEMNGIEAFKNIRNINADLPVIMMTAYDDPLLEKEAVSLGAYRYIYKPFKISQLVAIAKDLLNIK